jgi:membrane-associated phospholipid phosphatase
MAGLLATTAKGDDYLSAGEIAAIGSASAGAFLLAHEVNQFDSTRSIFWNQPSGLDRRLQYALGGRYYPDKTNFVDGKTGSAITPVATILILGAADLAYPQRDRGKSFLQDQFLFVTGIGATKAVTGLAKGLFRRTRPMLVLEPELAARRQEIDFRFDHQAFMSGHASSAFFSMTFLNLRIRSIMRSEMTEADYRNWRWLPPTVCFSWASFVGWSRISLYKHYLSDVVAGAVTGWLLAELFIRLAPDAKVAATSPNEAARRPLFLQLTFPL